MKKSFILFLMASLLVPVSMFSQNIQVKGRIMDETTSQGLPNVSVTLVGSNQGTNTDEAGNFSLLSPPASSKGQLKIGSFG